MTHRLGFRLLIAAAAAALLALLLWGWRQGGPDLLLQYVGLCA